MELMSKLEFEFGRRQMKFPETIVWVIGPPASGKTTLSQGISDQLGFVNTPVHMRQICREVIMKNDGKLDIDAILETLIRKLLEAGQNGGVVVDDFLSITCARALPFIYHYMQMLQKEIGRKKIVFKFCVLYATAQNSLKRQKIKRGDA